MSNDVALIKERLNIVDVVGEYVRLTKAGTNHKARCPFHEEKSPSFIVTEERGSYHCFGCGEGGDVISFVMAMESIEFRDALKLLAERAGIELQKYTPEQKAAADTKNRLVDLTALSVKFYEKQLWESPAGEAIKTYLYDRGLTDETIKKFQVGYAPEGWDHLLTFLTGRKYTSDEMMQAGFLIAKEGSGHYDRFRNRVMFPIGDPLGRVIGYSARIAPGADTDPEKTPAKYINTPESPLYHKSDVLYGIDHAKQAIKKADRVVVVEGNMDVIAMHQAGMENTVAISGTAMTESHIRVLKRYTTNFTLFFDADDAGQKAAAKSALACLAADVNLSFVTLGHGKDAADLALENVDELRAAVSNALPALAYFVATAKAQFDFQDPRAKRMAAENVLSYAALIPHPVERSEWITKCAQELSIAEDDARTIVEEHINNAKEPSRQAQSPPKAPPKDLLDSVEPLFIQIALAAFSSKIIWKTLYEKREEYEFWQKVELLATLMREGPPHEYDRDVFIEAGEGRDNLYPKIHSFEESFALTHPAIEEKIDFLMGNLDRAQAEYERKKLFFFLQKKGEAEKKDDHVARDHYAKEIEKLTSN